MEGDKRDGDESKSEAIQCKDIAEKMIINEEYMGARDMLLQAQKLFPLIENIEAMLLVCDILCASAFRLQGSSGVDYYWVLQILPSVNDTELKSQYDKLVDLLNHIKNFPGADMAIELVQYSFSVLSDSDKRSAFDLKRTGSWDSCNEEGIATAQNACGDKRTFCTGEVSDENNEQDVPVKRVKCYEDAPLTANHVTDIEQIDTEEAIDDVDRVTNGISSLTETPLGLNVEVETSKMRKSKSVWFGRRLCRGEYEKSARKVGSSSGQGPLVRTLHEELSDNKDYTNIDSYTRVYDNENHMCRHIAKGLDDNTLKFRGGWKSTFDWYRKFSEFSPRVKAIVDRLGFGQFFTIDVGNSDQRLVAALMERWWDTTHTFHLPCGEIGFTPLDFTMLTGIPIGNGEPLPFNTDFETFEDALEYFPLLQAEDIRSYAIRLPHFEIYLAMFDVEGEEEIVARAFVMYAMGHCFFPNGNNTIRIGWLAALHDMEKIGCYDWGTPILARLYKALDTCSRLQCKSMTALWQPLEFWFYEYLGVCHPTLHTDIGHCRPRILRWNDEYRARGRDQIRFNMQAVREQIEMASSDSILWQPWANYPNLDHADIATAWDLSRKRVLLYDPMIKGTWYLGDRCWRQVSGAIAIPRDPPLTMKHSESIPREEVKALKRQGWINAEHYVTYGIDYRLYWEKVSIGPLLHVVFQKVNRDVGVASVKDPVMPLSQRSQPVHEQQSHETQRASQRPSHDIVDAGWFVDVAGSGEQTHTIAVPSLEDTPLVLAPSTYSRDQWAFMYFDSLRLNTGIRRVIMQETRKREEEIRRAHEQIAVLRAELESVNSKYSALLSPTESNNHNKYEKAELI